MARWANQDAYLSEIEESIAATGGNVPREIVLGVIATESGFDPSAGGDVGINGGSWGLMQMSLRTAQGLGYKGTAQGLLNPATNIALGVYLLADGMRRHSGDLLAAVSAYNNGNGKRVTSTVTVCDERDTAHNCLRSHVAAPGQFFNQPYVDRVLANARYFGSTLTDGGVQPGGDGPASSSGLLVLLVAVAGVAWAVLRGRSA